MRSALLLLWNLARTALLPLWLLNRRLNRPRGRWVEVRLHAHPVEVEGRLPLWRRFLPRRDTRSLRSLSALRQLCGLVAKDARIDGLLLHLPHLEVGWATCTSLREVLGSLRKRGKRVAVYLPLGGGNRELYVALAAELVLSAPQAPLSLIGLGSQLMYFKPLLDRLGLQAEALAHGQYKTAAEPLLRESMSDAQREQLGALLATLQGALEQAVAERKGFDAERVRGLFERGLWGARAALQEGVLDATCYEDELPSKLGIAETDASPFVPEHDYLAFHQARLWHRLREMPQIAVVHVHGTIAHSASPLPGTRIVTHQELAATLRLARKSKRVHAVLLHIDSPGGSALASDLIHRELLRLREKKPLVAFMGNVAASGGYYVAAPCQKIIAQPTTLTGSIGVISLRLLASALAERVGLRPQSLRAAPHADMLSPFRPADEREQAMLGAETDATYRGFIEVVAQGRQRTTEQVEAVAQGRVWSAKDALGHGLVDELGGFERAVSILKGLTPSLRELPEDGVAVRVLAKGDAELPPAEPIKNAAWIHPAGDLSRAVELLTAGEHVLLYATLPDFC